MREITSHRVNPANDKLAITIVDEPGAGGANHAYLIHGYDDSRNASVRGADAPVPNGSNTLILFQNGPIAEAGVNGLTQEVLLAVLIDRLEAFQSGQFANDYNAAALDHLRSAQGCLFARTQERMSRGVEGTHKA